MALCFAAFLHPVSSFFPIFPTPQPFVLPGRNLQLNTINTNPSPKPSTNKLLHADAYLNPETVVAKPTNSISLLNATSNSCKPVVGCPDAAYWSCHLEGKSSRSGVLRPLA